LDGGARPAGRRPVNKRLLVLILALAVARVLLSHNGVLSRYAQSRQTPPQLDDEQLADAAARDATQIPVLLARAQVGDASAMYFYGSMYDPDPNNFFYTPAIAQKDAKVAIYWYDRAVALNDQGAERNLGIATYDGVGVPKNLTTAAALFERAAAKNDDYGDYWLGFMLEHGQGEAGDLPRAVALEQAGAAQGFAPAERELGSMYFGGIGVARSVAQADHYWGLAAAQGDGPAKNLLGLDGKVGP